MSGPGCAAAGGGLTGACTQAARKQPAAAGPKKRNQGFLYLKPIILFRIRSIEIYERTIRQTSTKLQQHDL
jgi:hypothetical protein